jgi:hypothetical protein
MYGAPGMEKKMPKNKTKKQSTKNEANPFLDILREEFCMQMPNDMRLVDVKPIQGGVEVILGTYFPDKELEEKSQVEMERFKKNPSVFAEMLHGFRDTDAVTDKVNHPSHYNTGKIEVIEAIEDWKLDYHCGNAVKYVARAGKKDPSKEVEDLQKAIWYLNRKVEKLKAAKEGRESKRPNDMPIKR